MTNANSSWAVRIMRYHWKETSRAEADFRRVDDAPRDWKKGDTWLTDSPHSYTTTRFGVFSSWDEALEEANCWALENHWFGSTDEPAGERVVLHEELAPQGSGWDV